MKKKIIIFVQIIIITLLSQVSYAQNVNIPEGCSYILMDAKTGQVILENNADVKIRPASTTKVMTAILALESDKLDTVMKVSENAVYDIGEGGMNVGIMPGEDNLTLDNMVNVLLVKSANETANIIAENLAGSKEEFVKRMNEKAIELGAYNTNFVNPCGKDDAKGEENHLSTARDMALITKYAMSMPRFRNIVSKEYYNGMPSTNKHKKWDMLQTTNRLLWYDNKYPYTINGTKYLYTVNGVKTGYTNAAGNNLISSAINDDGLELIAAVMHVNEVRDKVFAYTKELMRYGFESYANKKLIAKDTLIKSVSIKNGEDIEKLDLVAKESFWCIMPINSTDKDYVAQEKINFPIKLPVKKGDVLGVVEYKRNGITLGKVDAVASRAILDKVVAKKIENAQKEKATKGVLSKIVTILVAVICFFFVLRFTLRRISRRVKRLNNL